ncbi:unnamed protein product [Arctogadus glacialis]
MGPHRGSLRALTPRATWPRGPPRGACTVHSRGDEADPFLPAYGAQVSHSSPSEWSGEGDGPRRDTIAPDGRLEGGPPGPPGNPDTA